MHRVIDIISFVLHQLCPAIKGIMSALNVIISFGRDAHRAVSQGSLSRTCIKQKKQENIGEHSKIMPYFHSFHLNVIVHIPRLLQMLVYTCLS